jgi:DNA (cytosine-5)-methyltransferase 1
VRPKLLDLFCGAGGCSVGYHRAGFDVVGVDIRPQPNYPFEFVKAGALEFLKCLREADEIGDALGALNATGGLCLSDFAIVHASPPCQAFTQMSARYRGQGGKADSHPDFLTPTLAAMSRLELPWVVENVPGARRLMRPTVILHGGMFGLGVHRPRLFQSNVLLLASEAPRTKEPVGVYGTRPDGRVVWRNAGNYRKDAPHLCSRSVIRAARSLEQASEVMGIDWMTWPEIREAIPPAYTEFIGKQLLNAI